MNKEQILKEKKEKEEDYEKTAHLLNQQLKDIENYQNII